MFRRCQGVLWDILGVFCLPNGSGRAEKWTSVSPCLEAMRVSVDLLRFVVLATAAHAQGLTLVHVRAQLEQHQDTLMS